MIADLPTGNLTIVCLAGAVCFIFGLLCYLAHLSDAAAVSQMNDIIYFQENIPPKDPVYVITLKVEQCFSVGGETDMIMRVRGTLKDSPLVLFRDYDNRYITSGRTLSIGFSVPFDLGSLVEIDVAGDSNDFPEGSSLFSIVDVFIRKLPRKASALSTSKTEVMLEKKESPFEALSKNVRTWTSAESLVTGAGRRILGVSVRENGQSQLVQARSAPVTLTLLEEEPTIKQKASVGFRPLHYIWSLSPSWHQAWSEFSLVDHVMVMCLDLLATMVLTSTIYALGLEPLTGITFLTAFLFPPAIDGITSVEKFDLYLFMSDVKKFTTPLIHIAWITLISNILIIPISLLWCRLFRLIGGKGFERALAAAQPPEWPLAAPSRLSLEKAPQASAAHCLEDDDGGFGPKPIPPIFPPNLMLRVLECKSTHTASCVTSSRRLRTEPLLANCPADRITARTVAYVRTKMTRLRDDNILSGSMYLKHPDVLHESHTESTDAPQMPPPETAPDGSGEVVRVSRYCERLVQQAVRHIHDHSVIAECFEVDRNFYGVPRKGKKKLKCCPRRCCNVKEDAEESISNLTFFTPEDAISLQDLVEHLPEADPTTNITPMPPAGEGQFNWDGWNEEQVYGTATDTPLPSAKPRKSALKKFSFRNTFDPKTKRPRGKSRQYGSSRGRPAEEKQRKRRGISLVSSDVAIGLKRGRGKREKGKKKGVRFDDEDEDEEFVETPQLTPRSERKNKKERKEKRGKKEKMAQSEIASEGRKKAKREGKEKRGEKGKSGRENEESKKKKGKKEREKSRSSRRREKESRNVMRDSGGGPREKKGRKSKKDASSPISPRPATGPWSGAYPDATGGEDDWASAKSHMSDLPEGGSPAEKALPATTPFKGTLMKTCIFGLLLLLQMGEIFVVTGVDVLGNKYFIRATDGSGGPGAGRMHAALLSCVANVAWYFLCTVHVVALFSWLLEHLRATCFRSAEDDDADSVDSRPSLKVYP